MNVDSVNAAEKTASEVLHSLLSVERIEKPVHQLHGHVHQVVLVNSSGDSDHQRSVEQQRWNTSMQPAIFENYENDWADVDPVSEEQHIQLMENLTTSNDIDNHENEIVKHSTKVVKKVRKRYLKDMAVESSERNVKGLEESAQEVRARFQLGCECQDDCCFKGLNAENVYKHRLNIAELTKEEHDMYLMGVTMACMADPGVTAKQRIRRRLRAQYVYQGRRVCLSAFLYLENCTLYQLKRIRKHVMTHGVAPRVHGNHGKKPHNVFSLDTYRRATDFLKSCIEKYGVASSNPKAPVIFPADITRKTIHDMYKQMLLETGPAGQKVMGYTTFRHFMKVQFPQVRFCKLDSGSTLSTGESKSAIAKHVANIINNSINNSNSTTTTTTTSSSASSQHQSNHSQQHQPQNQLQRASQALPPVPIPPPLPAPAPSHQHHEPQQQHHILTTTNYVTNQSAGINEQQNVSLSAQTNPSNSLVQAACPVSVSGGTILSSAQMATIPVILSEPSKSDLTQQQTAFIVTPVSQLVQPFQAGHAITVTPISNTAYAFATL